MGEKGGRERRTRKVEKRTQDKQESVVRRDGGVLTKIYAHTVVNHKLLAKLDERLIEVEDILWQRAGEQEKETREMREGTQRGGSDDEHVAGERRRRVKWGRVDGGVRRDPRAG